MVGNVSVAKAAMNVFIPAWPLVEISVSGGLHRAKITHVFLYVESSSKSLVRIYKIFCTKKLFFIL